MKIKLVGILISIMLMTTFFTVAQYEKTPINSVKEKGQTTIITNVTVPDWNTGNSWSYQLDTIKFDFEEENGSSIHVSLDTKSLKLIVIDDTGELYATQLDAELQGEGTFNILTDDGPIIGTFELVDTDLTGTIDFDKTSLGITQITPRLSGTFLLNIDKQPYIPFSLPKIRIPATINLSVESSTPYTILNFPFTVCDVWGLPETNITLDGTIESFWLRLLYRINNIIQKYWNIIKVILPIIGIDPEMIKPLSDCLANPNLLPIIKIGPLLEEYLNTSTFEFPEIEPIIHCNNTEIITVPAGTFEVYNLSVAEGMGNLYYAPLAGMIVKISGQFNEIIPFMTNLNAELLEYSYP